MYTLNVYFTSLGIFLLNAIGSDEPPTPATSSPLLQGHPGLLSRFLGFILGRQPLVVLSRACCHRILIDLTGVPRRLIASSLELQLLHLSGLTKFGYAWQQQGSKATVWYWEESEAQSGIGVQLCPEMLLRPTMADGLYLVHCLSGVEAVYVSQTFVHRTRWFESVPDTNAWQQFVRDTGNDPSQYPLPGVRQLVLSERPTRSWSLRSSLTQSLGRNDWALLLVVTLVGAALCLAIAYSIKLNFRLDTLRTEHSAYLLQNDRAVKLQRQLDTLQKQIAQIAVTQPKTLQTKVMAALAQSALFNETTLTSLQEWEYRDNRIRLQIAVPQDGFVLSQFLEKIEKLGMFTQLRLLPSTTALSVALQASLKGDVAPAKEDGFKP